MPPWGPLALALPLLKIDLTLASSGNSASPMKPNAFLANNNPQKGIELKILRSQNLPLPTKEK